MSDMSPAYTPEHLNQARQLVKETLLSIWQQTPNIKDEATSLTIPAGTKERFISLSPEMARALQHVILVEMVPLNSPKAEHVPEWVRRAMSGMLNFSVQEQEPDFFEPIGVLGQPRPVLRSDTGYKQRKGGDGGDHMKASDETQALLTQILDEIISANPSPAGIMIPDATQKKLAGLPSEALLDIFASAIMLDAMDHVDEAPLKPLQQAAIETLALHISELVGFTDEVSFQAGILDDLPAVKQEIGLNGRQT